MTGRYKRTEIYDIDMQNIVVGLQINDMPRDNQDWTTSLLDFNFKTKQAQIEHCMSDNID